MRLKMKGSITVEAVFVLPVFLFGILGFMYFLQILSLQTSIQSALKDTANTGSLYGYFDEAGKSIPGLQAAFELHMAQQNINKTCIEGGVISLLGSYYDSDDIVIIADYRLKLPLPLLNLKGFSVKHTARTRKFIGMDRREGKGSGGLGGNREENDRYVFVAENGIVYHESENCSHLKLKVEKTIAEQVIELRNEAGGRYKPCNLCAKNEDINSKGLYIALDGNKYHLSRGCSGLKRTVRRVLFSSISGWKGCTRCA